MLSNLLTCFAWVNTNLLDVDAEDVEAVEEVEEVDVVEDVAEDAPDEELEESDEDAIVDDELSEDTLLPVLFLSPHAEKAPIIKVSDNVSAKILLIDIF